MKHIHPSDKFHHGSKGKRDVQHGSPAPSRQAVKPQHRKFLATFRVVTGGRRAHFHLMSACAQGAAEFNYMDLRPANVWKICVDEHANFHDDTFRRITPVV